MIEEMLDYQKRDADLKTLESEIESSEDFKRASKARQLYSDARNRMQACEDKAEDTIKHYMRLKKQLDEVLEKVKEVEDDALESTEDDDISYLTSSIAKLKETVRQIEGELNQIMSEIDAITRSNNDARRAAVTSKSNFDEAKAKFDAFKDSKQEARDKIVAELDEKSKKIDRNLLEKYKEKRAQRIFPIMTPLFDGNRCGTCRMELAMNTLSTLKTEEFIECDSCHRLIYK